MKKPCLISFDFCPSSFGDGLIHERLSVRLSLNTDDMQRICSNICFTLKADSALPITESAISLTTAYNDSGNHPTNLKNHINVSFPDDITCNPMKFHIVLDVFKLADSDNENVRALNANESRKDGLKSKTSRRCAFRRASGSSATC